MDLLQSVTLAFHSSGKILDHILKLNHIVFYKFLLFLQLFLLLILFLVNLFLGSANGLIKISFKIIDNLAELQCLILNGALNCKSHLVLALFALSLQ